MYQRSLISLFLLLALVSCGNDTDRKKEERQVESCDGLHQCGSDCVDLTTNVTHCGQCDSACQSGNYCVAGKCVAGCQGGQLGVCDGACIDRSTSHANCGTCGHSCEIGEVCAAGECGQVCSGKAPLSCSGTYVDPTSNRLHCGECGRGCAEDEVCSDGQCRADCTGRFPDQCGVTCVDRQSDPAHCGSCFSGCGEGEVCVAGECRDSCGPARPLLCEDLCVDPETDVRFCGNCQTACDAGHRCSEGLCVAGCEEPGQSVCSGNCVNLQTDLDHCGECGAGCVDGSVCRDGVCAKSCGGNFPDECSGVCTDIASNVSHCGECGNACGKAEVCTEGECRLTCSGQTQTLCGRGCVDLENDPRHCGKCGEACPAGSVCEAGRCEALCDADKPTLCDGQCVNTFTNNDHCKACGHACDAGEHCDEAECRTTFETIRVGLAMVCATKVDSTTMCWGDNRFGSVAPGATLEDLVEAELTGLPGSIVELELGWEHACALIVNGGTKQVACWGHNDRGQANGTADTPTLLTAHEVITLPAEPQEIAIGHGHSCALLVDGTVSCWGAIDFNSAGDSVAPSDLGLTNIVRITSGGAHSCARENDGTIHCWGSNFVGQLGIPGVPLTGSMPLEVAGVAEANHPVEEGRELVAGGGATCAIVDNGDVSCWGDNSFEQLGRGTTPPPDDHIPAQVVGLPARAVALFGGDSSFCAKLETDDLYCWGKHQAAGSSTALYGTPTLIAPEIRSAGLHTDASFLITNQGSILSWGSADAGLLYRAPFGRFSPKPCCE